MLRARSSNRAAIRPTWTAAARTRGRRRGKHGGNITCLMCVWCFSSGFQVSFKVCIQLWSLLVHMVGGVKAKARR